MVISFCPRMLRPFWISYFYSAKRNKKPLYTYGNKGSHKKLGLVFGLAVFVSIDVKIAVQSNNDLVGTFFQFSKSR